MTNEGKRLWIDGHTHLLRRTVRGAEDLRYTLDDVLTVLEGCDADLRFIVSDNNPADVDRIVEEPEFLHAMNERVYRDFVQPSGGRLFGSVQIDPRAVKQSHKDLDLYLGERNFVQVGEVEGMPFGFPLDSLQMVELARHAGQLGAPVQLHCSTADSPTGEHLRQALHLAAEVPECNFIIAHAIGGRNSYHYISAIEQYLARGLDNVYLEIIQFHLRAHLRSAYEHLGPERLVVGTDWATYHGPPWPPYGTHTTLLSHPDFWRQVSLKGFSQWNSEFWFSSMFMLDLRENPYPARVSSLVGFMQEAGFSDEDIEKVGSGNAIRLFRLREKGLLP
ncbi:MAG: amidohydrolase [Anaerolineae bacterium]|nr:amidohydrolase [Anaerolineae bacterium]